MKNDTNFYLRYFFCRCQCWQTRWKSHHHLCCLILSLLCQDEEWDDWREKNCKSKMHWCLHYLRIRKSCSAIVNVNYFLRIAHAWQRIAVDKNPSIPIEVQALHQPSSMHALSSVVDLNNPSLASFFLAHLSTTCSGGAIVTGHRPSSVRPSVRQSVRPSVHLSVR